jgi:hypothetical protein
MGMPGFTAEAALAKTERHYAQASGAGAADAGRVVPQGLHVVNGHLWYCYDEGGFSGCVDLGSVAAHTLM